MKPCTRHGLIQDLLDDRLPESEARALREHLGRCPACAMEWGFYRRAFEALDRLPLADPAPTLMGRVLERALPSRVRRRWVATVGWSYAGTLAVSLAAAMLWISRPGPWALLESLWGEASRRLVQSLAFALNALAFAVLSLANGWGLLAAAGQRLAPLSRALSALLSHPAIETALGLAGVACIALLWWMRPHEKHPGKEIRHVGVLGF